MTMKNVLKRTLLASKAGDIHKRAFENFIAISYVRCTFSKPRCDANERTNVCSYYLYYMKVC